MKNKTKRVGISLLVFLSSLSVNVLALPAIDSTSENPTSSSPSVQDGDENIPTLTLSDTVLPTETPSPTEQATCENGCGIHATYIAVRWPDATILPPLAENATDVSAAYDEEALSSEFALSYTGEFVVQFATELPTTVIELEDTGETVTLTCCEQYQSVRYRLDYPVQTFVPGDENNGGNELQLVPPELTAGGDGELKLEPTPTAIDDDGTDGDVDELPTTPAGCTEYKAQETHFIHTGSFNAYDYVANIWPGNGCGIYMTEPFLLPPRTKTFVAVLVPKKTDAGGRNNQEIGQPTRGQGLPQPIETKRPITGGGGGSSNNSGRPSNGGSSGSGNNSNGGNNNSGQPSGNSNGSSGNNNGGRPSNNEGGNDAGSNPATGHDPLRPRPGDNSNSASGSSAGGDNGNDFDDEDGDFSPSGDPGDNSSGRGNGQGNDNDDEGDDGSPDNSDSGDGGPDDSGPGDSQSGRGSSGGSGQGSGQGGDTESGNDSDDANDNQDDGPRSGAPNPYAEPGAGRGPMPTDASSAILYPFQSASNRLSSISSAQSMLACAITWAFYAFMN